MPLVNLEDMFEDPREAERATEWFASQVAFPNDLRMALNRLAVGEHLYIVYPSGCAQKATVIRQREESTQIKFGPPMARCPGDAPIIYAVMYEGKIVGFSICLETKQ